jgi:hypothetical protein
MAAGEGGFHAESSLTAAGAAAAQEGDVAVSQFLMRREAAILCKLLS